MIGLKLRSSTFSTINISRNSVIYIIYFFSDWESVTHSAAGEDSATHGLGFSISGFGFLSQSISRFMKYWSWSSIIFIKEQLYIPNLHYQDFYGLTVRLLELARDALTSKGLWGTFLVMESYFQYSRSDHGHNMQLLIEVLGDDGLT
ncbi:hypothetical protein L6452_33920 [Arctium lappa]|uniref:Uncharacterized protein n=1 Tax=Arctium lappa TaxID=4217 RepID=A0ACB8YGT1_ARCLA|nr:hypothetical protein L6452_33920 [Arctium lappa]